MRFGYCQYIIWAVDYAGTYAVCHYLRIVSLLYSASAMGSTRWLGLVVVRFIELFALRLRKTSSAVDEWEANCGSRCNCTVWDTWCGAFQYNESRMFFSSLKPCIWS